MDITDGWQLSGVACKDNYRTEPERVVDITSLYVKFAPNHMSQKIHVTIIEF